MKRSQQVLFVLLFAFYCLHVKHVSLWCACCLFSSVLGLFLSAEENVSTRDATVPGKILNRSVHYTRDITALWTAGFSVLQFILR